MRKEQRKMRETTERIAAGLEDNSLTSHEKAKMILAQAKKMEKSENLVAVRVDKKTVRLMSTEKARRLGVIK